MATILKPTYLQPTGGTIAAHFQQAEFRSGAEDIVLVSGFYEQLPEHFRTVTAYMDKRAIAGMALMATIALALINAGAPEHTLEDVAESVTGDDVDKVHPIMWNNASTTYIHLKMQETAKEVMARYIVNKLQ